MSSIAASEVATACGEGRAATTDPGPGGGASTSWAGSRKAISGLPAIRGDRTAHPHHAIADARFEIARELVAVGGEDGRREPREVRTEGDHRRERRLVNRGDAAFDGHVLADVVAGFAPGDGRRSGRWDRAGGAGGAGASTARTPGTAKSIQTAIHHTTQSRMPQSSRPWFALSRFVPA